MKHRELIEATIRRAGHGGASGFWVGHPAAETKSIYSEALGLGGLRQEARVKGSIQLSDNCDSREIEFQEARFRSGLGFPGAGSRRLEASRRQAHVGLLRP